MERKLIWLEANRKREYKINLKENNFRLWVLIGENQVDKAPDIPEKLEHQRNAFLESPMHDYSISNGKMRYYGNGIINVRGRERGTWAVIEYEES